MKARARGRAYPCACGEEKLRLTRRGPDARHDNWSYLVGECGGGVKLRFQGAKIVEVRTAERTEVDRVRMLPARQIDIFDVMLERLDERARRRLEEIRDDIREAIQAGMTKWMLIGERLAEAKRLLKKGDFGLWVERNGMDRVHAHKFITTWETIRSAPRDLHKLFVKIGQEKTVALTRLPEGKRLEILEHGVPIAGKPVPIEQVTFRQLNGYVRSIVGRDPRGRKPKGAAAAKPTERFGLPIEIVEAFQGTLQHLGALSKKAKLGWSEREKPAARKFWGNINHLFFKLQDDLGMALLLTEGGR